jgi:hypothetical protein
MQSEWKIKQEIYHRLNRDHDDDLNDKDIEMSSDIVGNAIRYFNETDIGWIYPAKSYMVAICYARWLSEDYGDRALTYLDDPDLLYGNDPYFRQYSREPHTYIHILNEINGWDFDETKGMVPDVRKYYEAECGIE